MHVVPCVRSVVFVIDIKVEVAPAWVPWYLGSWDGGITDITVLSARCEVGDERLVGRWSIRWPWRGNSGSITEPNRVIWLYNRDAVIFNLRRAGATTAIIVEGGSYLDIGRVELVALPCGEKFTPLQSH